MLFTHYFQAPALSVGKQVTTDNEHGPLLQKRSWAKATAVAHLMWIAFQVTDTIITDNRLQQLEGRRSRRLYADGAESEEVAGL